MRNNFLCISMLSGFLAASPALSNTIQATFTGVNGANDFGYYIGPYYGQLESQNVSLFCDDFANEVSFGQTWQANLSKITAGSDLSQTRYGDVANAPRLYQEIAWLDTQFGQQDGSKWGDIHATIWQIFDPKEAPVPTSNFWLTQAEKNYNTIDYSNFRVVTNAGPVAKTGQVQEFLTILPQTSSPSAVTTPEPAPAILIGSVLAASLFAMKLFRRRRNVEG